MRSRKFEMIIPVFLGCLGSMILCALLMLWQSPAGSAVVEDQEAYHAAMEEDHAETEMLQFFTQAAERRDLIMELYRDPEARSRVTDFFTEICASAEIAEAILANAELFDIPPALAVALAWEESRLNPRAVNTKNRDESIDRGLFQLNNRSFPRLDTHSFFNLRVNAKYGMSHLRHCLDTGGSEIAALAMYNAGTGRVKSSGTPMTTLSYASRIMENRWMIEARFQQREAQFQEQQYKLFIPEVAEAKQPSRFVPLMPLANLSPSNR